MNKPNEGNGSRIAHPASKDKVFWGLELRFIRTERGLRISGHTLVTIFLLVILLSPLLTYSIPDDVLMRWPYTASFADLIARLAPSIDKLTAISQFPQVTRLFMAILWGVVFPLFLWLTAITILQVNPMRRWNVPPWVVWLAPFGAAVFCWLSFVNPTITARDFASLPCDSTPFDQGVCLASDSRLWLGLFGTPDVLIAAIIIVGIFRWPQVIRMYYSNKRY